MWAANKVVIMMTTCHLFVSRATMRAANGRPHVGDLPPLKVFEADYAGRELGRGSRPPPAASSFRGRLCGRKRNDRSAFLFNRLHLLDSPRCLHDPASRAVGPFQTFTRSAGSSIVRRFLAAIASVRGAFRGGRSTS